MRRVREIVESYDTSNAKEKKKVVLINWFQQHPGKRFDKSEIHQELGEELDIGQRSVGDYLKELESEDVLISYGEQRISYRLEDDIIIPVEYQIRAGLDILFDIFSMNRWGVFGFLVVTTSFWGILTIPFWFFSFILLITPRSQIATISQYEMFIFTFAMTIWLIVFSLLTFTLVRVHRRRIISKD